MKRTIPLVGPGFDVDSSTEAPVLEFVTVTGMPFNSNIETSKQIRTHAMKDYVWKLKNNLPAIAQVTVAALELEKPAKYKGRFKLEGWTHSSKAKSKPKSKNSHSSAQDVTKGVGHHEGSKNSGTLGDRSKQDEIREELQAFLLVSSSRMDPFNSLSLELGCLSEKILYHYHTSYSMNGVAINPEGDFFSKARSDPAMLHSVLHLVALHHDLKSGISESRGTLHHGGEAFKIINKRLRTGGRFSDMTIAAVAMLANKENLNGKYDLSKMHIQGLKYMVSQRGGIHTLDGVFQRIVTWSDFCFANIWACKPAFPRQNIKSLSTKKRSRTKRRDLRLEDAFRSDTPIINIFDSIRTLSFDLDPNRIANVDRVYASNLIYNLEYDLLLLNEDPLDLMDSNAPQYSFEVLSLKTAVHIYLYLVIREIPAVSKTINRLVLRLQDSLDCNMSQWWSSSLECQIWLLWILFIGCAASYGRDERVWFIHNLRMVTYFLEIFSLQELEDQLKKILWQDAFCNDHCRSIWDDVLALGELEDAFTDPVLIL